MPVYDYKCRSHGEFHQLATLADAALPQPCPQCRELAGRIIKLPAFLAELTAETRQAHARNERSQHAPLTAEEHREHRGCGCAGDTAKGRRAILTPRGEKVFPSARPWMISH